MCLLIANAIQATHLRKLDDFRCSGDLERLASEQSKYIYILFIYICTCKYIYIQRYTIYMCVYLYTSIYIIYIYIYDNTKSRWHSKATEKHDEVDGNRGGDGSFLFGGRGGVGSRLFLASILLRCACGEGGLGTWTGMTALSILQIYICIHFHQHHR